MKISRCATLIIAIFILLISASPGYSKFVLIEKSVATVGGEVILESDLDKYACYVSLKNGGDVKGLDRRSLLSEMINEIVIVREVNRTGSIEIEPARLHEKIGEIGKIILKCQEECGDLCKDVNYPAKRARVEISREEFIRQRIERFVKVTEGDIFQYYLLKPGDYPNGYNEKVKEKIRIKLKNERVKENLTKILNRVKKRIKIIIPED